MSARDLVTDSIWENQRRGAFSDYSAANLTSLDAPAWSDATGKPVEAKTNAFPQDGKKWKWSTDWEVVKNTDTDAEGWQYAVNFSNQLVTHAFANGPSMMYFVRRRVWQRRRVAALPEDAKPKAAKPAAADVRGDLFSGNTAAERKQAADRLRAQQSAERDAEEALHLSGEAEAASARALKQAQDAEAIGQTILGDLAVQRDTLQRIDGHLDQIDTKSDQGKRLISGMQSIGGAFVNVFRTDVSAKKTDSSQHYAGVRTPAAAAAAAPAPAPKPAAASAQSASAGAAGSAPGKLRSNNPRPGVPAGARYQDAFGDDQGSQIQARMERADQNVEQLGDAVARMKGIASAMGDELQAQNTHITHLNDRMDVSTDKIKGNRQNMKRVT